MIFLNTNILKKMTDHLLTIKRETMRMMLDRGYSLGSEAFLLEKDITPEDFRRYYTDMVSQIEKSGIKQKVPTNIREYMVKSDKTDIRTMMSNIYYKIDEKGQESDPTLVYFGDTSGGISISIDEVTFLGSLMNDLNVKQAVFITPKNLSSTAQARLAMMGTPREVTGGQVIGYFIQHFLDEDFTYSPVDHIYTPKHTLLTPEEKRDFLTRNSIRENQLPKITMDDAIAKWLGARPRDLIKIERTNFIPDTLIDEEIFYRIVYQAPPEKKKR